MPQIKTATLILSFTTLLMTGCSELAFVGQDVSCKAPESSAKFGVNDGPIILYPTIDTFSSGTLAVTGSCVSGMAVEIKEGIAGTPVSVECKNGSFSTQFTVSEGDGSKDLIVTQKSAADGSDIMDRLCFQKDTTPPAVSISQGNSAQSSNSGRSVVQGTCEVGLPVLVWGPGLSTPISTDCNNGQFTATLETSQGDGLKDIVAGQMDRAGNQGKDATSVNIDTLPPQVQITSAIPALTNLSSLPVSGICEKGLPVEIGAFRATTAPAVTCNNGTFSANIPLVGADGPIQLQVHQVDLAGNLGVDTKNTIKDTVAPAVTILSPLANAYLTPTSTFSGACETGINVSLSGSALAAPQTVACSSGQWTLTAAVAAGSGAKDLQAVQTDAAGNTGKAQQSYIVDTMAPSLAITSPDAGSYVGASFMVGGQCETGLMVQLSGGGILPSTSTSCTNGAFSALVNTSPLDGSKEVIAQQTDAGGNTATATRTFLRDSLPPRLTIATPAEGAFIRTTLTLTGACEAGLKIQFTGTGLAASGSAVCSSAGTYSVNLTVSDGEGAKAVTAREVDAAGNESLVNASYMRDTKAPAVVIQTPDANTTAQTGLTVGGTCEAGLNVTLSGSGVASNVVSMCSPQGTFSAAITFSSGGGSKQVTAAQTDAAGNTGSDSRSFVSDMSAPAITITAPAANSYLPVNFTVEGACEKGLNVVVGGAGVAAEVTVACPAATYTAAVTVSAGDGAKVVTAKQTDAAGNMATASRTFQRDTTAPVLTITSPADGTSGGTGITLVGTCETGLTVNISGSGVSAPSSVTCVNGGYQTNLTFSGTDGAKTVLVSETDAAGNSSQVTGTFNKDTTAPTIAITAPAAGTVAQAGLNVVGTCEAGLNVTLAGTGVATPVVVPCTTAGFSGDITFSAGEGSKLVTASQTDALGNTGTASRSFVRDNSGPAITITAPAANSYLPKNFTVQGACETGSNVTVGGAGVAAEVSVACTNGAYSAAMTVSAEDGSKLVTAKQADAAGNIATASRTFQRDTTAPVLTITSPANGTSGSTGVTLVGTCETGLTVNFSGSGVSAPSSVTCVNGGYQASLTFSGTDGAKTVLVSETDAAGNNSQVTGSFNKDTTGPSIAITAPAAGTVAQTGLTVVGTCETGLNVTLAGTGVATPVVVSCTSGGFSGDITFSADEGSKLVTASQTDALGNTGTTSRSFVRDNSGPAITITAPAANSYLPTNFTVQGACETGLSVVVGGAGVASEVSVACTNAAYSAAMTVSAGDGSKLVTAKQTDAAGNMATASRTFQRDTTAPVLTITSPANGTTASTGVTLVGKCETGLTVNFSGSGVKAPSSVTCVNGGYQADLTFSGTDGTKNVLVSETDAAGNNSQVTGTFNKDTTAPSIAITAPAAGTVAQTGLTVVGTCETGLNVTLAGTGVATPVVVSCTTSGFSGAITFSAGDGSKLVTASQTDALGNTGTASRSFMRDTTGPAITITAPAANSYLPTNFTVQGACETGLDVVVGGAGVASEVSVACTNAAYSAAMTVSAGDGAKVVTAKQADAVGNMATASRTFQRDTTAPVLTITSPANGTTASTGVTLVGKCETGLTVKFSGTGVSAPSSVTCVNGGYQADLTFSGTDGTKTVLVSETDAAGNNSQVTGTFNKDTTGPSIAITAPAAGTVAQTGLTVVGTCETGLNVTLAGTGVATSVVVPCTSAGFSGDITFSAGEGSKLVTASQTDALGNTGTASRSFVRDNSGPTITITAPAANSYLPTNFTVQGACETGLSVVVGGAGVASEVTVSCANSAYSAAVTVSAGDGSKVVTAKQTDAAGNMATASRTFQRDGTAPALTITSPVSGTSVGITEVLKGTCETGLTVSVSGDITAASGSCTAGAFSIGITFSTGRGVKNVVAKQTDVAGNVGQVSASYNRDSDASSETFISDASFGKIDILFIDDNSASMDPNQASLGTKFAGFSNELKSIDWQIGITTTDCSTGPYGICGSLLTLTGYNGKILTPNVPNYQTVFNDSIQRPETAGCLNRGTCPSGASEPLLSATTAMNKFNTDNNGFFRSNSDLAIVILSDADERQTGGATYQNRPSQLVSTFNSTWTTGKKLKVYSIIVKPGDTTCLNTMRAGSGGFSFFGELIDQTVQLTSGLSTSICAPDYSVTLKSIGESVRTLTNSVELKRTPIPSSVVVTFTPAQTIGYKVIGNKVVFDAPPSVGTEIKVDYLY